MDDDICAGLCFFDHRLFYAVSSTQDAEYIRHVGTIDFNFKTAESLFSNEQESIRAVQAGVRKLIDRFDIDQLNVLQYPQLECWATLPKHVCDDADERRAYINILANGMKRKYIYSSLHALSNRGYKLLLLRSMHTMRRLKRLTDKFPNVEFCSAFEMGERWVDHSNTGGSVLTINRFFNCISICSFVLGNLRGATYITFDDAADLPYLWLQKAKDLPWLQGLHEYIYLSGEQTQPVIDRLQPIWDKAGTVTRLDTLDKMQVQAEEQTYSFDLSMAYPPIMLALL